MSNCRNCNRNHFFTWDFYSLLFYTESFQVPPEKNHPHLKCQSPLKIPIWTKSLLYKRSEKWLSPPSLRPLSPKGGGGFLRTPCLQNTSGRLLLIFPFLDFCHSAKCYKKKSMILKWLWEKSNPQLQKNKRLLPTWQYKLISVKLAGWWLPMTQKMMAVLVKVRNIKISTHLNFRMQNLA